MSQNIVPIIDPNRGRRRWFASEIFDGVGPGRNVPNKGDLVFSDTDGWCIVNMVDYTTGMSQYAPFRPPSEQIEVDVTDTLVGYGPGLISESFFLLLDTSVIPHTLTFDRRLRVYGTTVTSVKVIRGTRIENGEVISRMYDNQNQLIGDKIPLELVATHDTIDNLAIKTPKSGFCSLQLPDGEVCTAVFYDEVGNVASYSRLLIRNTQWMPRANESTRYVTGIELESPFLSEADNRVLECPINVPISNVARRGIVHYSNGDRRVLPLDGGKFKFFGLRRFTSTILGQRQPCTLVYYLSSDEDAVGPVNGETRHISEDYLATTVKVDGAYSVKLFTYPVWIDAINGYRLEHFLYNLVRDESFRVTDLVTLAVNSQNFDPLAYGVSQDLTFAISLNQVSEHFKAYQHLQTTRIALMAPGISENTRWSVTYDRTKEAYGENLFAEIEFGNGIQWKLRLDNGKGSREHWIRDTYDKTYPLYDETVEATPPVPNHIRIIAGNWTSEDIHISNWNHEFIINEQLNDGETVFVQFLLKDTQNTFELATAGFSVKRVFN